MARQYRYRKHLRWGQYVLPVFFGLGMVAPWVALVILLRIGSPEADEGFVFAPIMSFACLLIGGVCWWIYYRLAGVAITLEDDALVYRYRGGVKRLPYDHLEPLRFPSVRYVGGWVALRSGENTIRLTVVVEGIGALLQELKTALDSRGLSDRYDKDRFYGFLKTAEYCDQSWERVYGIFWRYIFATLGGAALGAAVGLIASMRPLAIIAWATVSALWPTGIFAVTEFHFGRRVAKLSEEASFTCPPRDLEWERTIYRKAIAWGLGSYLFFTGLALALAKY
jgi:hypothetical protein